MGVKVKKISPDELFEALKYELKQLRAKKGKTQIQVYQDTKIHIARIESKDFRPNLTLETLNELTYYYNIPLDKFMERVWQRVGKVLKQGRVL